MNTSSGLSLLVRSFVNWLIGLSYVRLGVLYGIAIVFIGCVYFFMAQVAPNHAPPLGGGPLWIQLLNGIYFSVITAASVGYGDITPHGISKLIAGIESLLSLFVFAILVSKPMSEKQDAVLYHMHKLTLDEIFVSIREGFYVMRQDFDAIMEEVRTSGTLSERGKENLETALHHGEVLLQDIPNFYDNERQLYVLDIRREQLLSEAVERTLERLLRTQGAISVHHIHLSDRTKAIHAGLVALADRILTKWKRHSSKTIHGSLERSMSLVRELRAKSL